MAYLITDEWASKVNEKVMARIRDYKNKMKYAEGSSSLEACVESRVVAYLNALADTGVINIVDWEKIHDFINA